MLQENCLRLNVFVCLRSHYKTCKFQFNLEIRNKSFPVDVPYLYNLFLIVYFVFEKFKESRVWHGTLTLEYYF